MIVEIKNSDLAISISAQGAELQSVSAIDNGLNYLWNGDPKYWGKKSPVLFPIVGGLKNNQYQHNGNTYQMNRHGFAREKKFDVTKQSDDSITFQLTSDEESLLVYPFHFLFSITYTLHGNTVSCTYTISNTGNEIMYASVGAHPAFCIPLTAGTAFSDWYLHFNKIESCNSWPLSADGLIEKQSTPFLQNTQTLLLSKELFNKDALVFKELQSTAISIQSNQSTHGLKMMFDGFPYFGIWSAKGADFICLEPWCGIADNVNTSGELKDKEGMNKILPGTTFSKCWSVEFY